MLPPHGSADDRAIVGTRLIKLRSSFGPFRPLLGALLFLALLCTATPLAAEAPLAPEARRQRAADIVVALREYRSSLEKLLAVYESSLAKATEQRDQRRDFHNRGIIGRREVEDAERAVTDARAKVDGTRQEIAAADQAIAEATNVSYAPQSQQKRVPPAAPRLVLALPNWSPLSRMSTVSSSESPKDPTVLFELLARSVWLVVASQSAAETDRDRTPARNVAVGSAVAITQKSLLTNCHLVNKRPSIWIKQGDLIETVKVMAGEAKSDRCILATDREMLSPVKRIRAYDGLKVGEQVFTVGSPSGLEATLAQGIVSGLRRTDSRRLVQTTAPISPGSSGGGLFDQSGNLVGITTFTLRDSQGLNFAIAAEDYFR
jgi:S1-C subfamily serine protease